MTNDSTVDRKGGYEAQSKRIVDIVLAALGLDVSPGADSLRQAQLDVCRVLEDWMGSRVEPSPSPNTHSRDLLETLSRAVEGERDLLTTIMDSTHTQLAYLDRQFNFVRVNAAYCQGSGHSEAELIDHNHFDLFPNDENRVFFEQVQDTGEPVMMEAKPFRFADQPERGTTYWDWTLMPVKGRDDTVRGLVLSLHDVTEQILARRALESEHAQLQTILENVPEGIVVADRAGRIQLTNPAADKLYARPVPYGESYEAHSELGLCHRDGTPYDPRDLPLTRAALDGETHHNLEMAIARPDGQQRELLVNAVPLVDSQGKVTGAVAAFHDITERVQQEKEIEQLRRQWELILASAGDGILGLNGEGRIMFANPTAADMVGWTANDLVGKPAHEVIHFAQADGVPYTWEECLVYATLVDGAVYSVSDEVFWRKDGTSFPVEYTSTPIIEVGDVTGAVLVFRDITERKQAQQEITDLARFPSENPHPVIRISREGVILYANQGSELILAVWSTQVGQPVPDDWRTLVAKAIAGGGVSVKEMVCGERTFALSIVPLETYVNLYGLDITSLKRTENALRRYADRLRVLRETDQAILAARTTKEIATSALAHMQQLIPFLRASVTLFSLEKAEMSPLVVYPQGGEGFDRAWLHPRFRDRFLTKLQKGEIVAIEDLDDLDSPLTTVDVLQGQVIRGYVIVPLMVQGALIGSLNLGLVASEKPGEEEIEIACEIADELAIGIQQARLLDQVERHVEQLERQVRHRTAALQISRARFQAVFEEAAIGIALVNRKGRILDSNPALQRMLGYKEAELEGVVFSGLAHPDNATDDAALYNELISGERTYYRLEGRYMCHDGRTIDANLTVSLVHPIKGRARFAIALVEDVTEQRQAQAALIESEKLALTGKIAASLAHEINNPMQSVIGLLSLVEEDLAKADLAADKNPLQYVEIAIEELERAAGLVANLRDLNRPAAPDRERPSDVNELVERVLILTRKRCQAVGVEVVWNPGADLPAPALLFDRMQQVLLNLVLNAVDAMPNGGRLQVSTKRCADPGGVQIQFTDNGTGIPSSELDHLFDPFYTTKSLGIGLGLYVSHGIIEDHGGRIEVESQVGEGATFTVWLPV